MVDSCLVRESPDSVEARVSKPLSKIMVLDRCPNHVFWYCTHTSKKVCFDLGRPEYYSANSGCLPISAPYPEVHQTQILGHKITFVMATRDKLER